MSQFGAVLSRVRRYLSGRSSAVIDSAIVHILDLAPDGILVADVDDADRRIIYVNSAFERITGYSRDEAIGKNCRYLQGSDRLQPEIATLRVQSRYAARRA